MNEYPKIMMVSNQEITSENKGFQRVVIQEITGEYEAWHGAETFEEAAWSETTERWKYAKEITNEDNKTN